MFISSNILVVVPPAVEQACSKLCFWVPEPILFRQLPSFFPLFWSLPFFCSSLPPNRRLLCWKNLQCWPLSWPILRHSNLPAFTISMMPFFVFRALFITTSHTCFLQCKPWCRFCLLPLRSLSICEGFRPNSSLHYLKLTWQIKHDQGHVRVLQITRYQTLESLLSCCIP